MRAARYCYAVVWCVVVGDSVRPGRGDGMEQVRKRYEALVDAYVELVCCAANEHDAGRISDEQFEALAEAERVLSEAISGVCHVVE